MTPFVMVGWGYRSRAWWEAARGIGAQCAGMVVRTPRDTPAPAYDSPTAMLIVAMGSSTTGVACSHAARKPIRAAVLNAISLESTG